MSQEVLRPPVIVSGERTVSLDAVSSFGTYLPSIIAIVASIALVFARIEFGGERFISNGALMMLALASYLIAAVFYLTNLYAPFRFAEKLGLWAATLGVFFNLSSWLVRWVAAYDRELQIFQTQGRDLAEMPWLFRYVPFANLYSKSGKAACQFPRPGALNAISKGTYSVPTVFQARRTLRATTSNSTTTTVAAAATQQQTNMQVN